MKFTVTWSACSGELPLPCCAWIFGNLYMQVGKSTFVSPAQTGFTWYMGMAEDSLRPDTEKLFKSLSRTLASSSGDETC